MSFTMQKGYPDYIGKRYAFCGNNVGPSSYLRSTGDALDDGQFQGQIDAVFVSESVSGTYFVRARPSAAGPRATWALHWYVVSGGAEVADAVDLSAETVIVAGFGGRY